MLAFLIDLWTCERIYAPEQCLEGGRKVHLESIVNLATLTLTLTSSALNKAEVGVGLWG